MLPTERRKEKTLISNNIHFGLTEISNQSNIYKRMDNEKTDPTREMTGCSGMVLRCFIIAHLNPIWKPLEWSFGWSITGATFPHPHPLKKPEREAKGPRKPLPFREALTFPAEHRAVVQQKPRDNGQSQQKEAHDGAHNSPDVYRFCKDKSYP